MTATSPPAYVQGGTYSASLDRLHQITADALQNPSLTFGAREGCFPARMPAFSNPSSWNVTVGPCSGITTNDFAASVGDYKWCNPSNAAVVLTASSGTLNRIDYIGLQVKDNFLDSSGLNSATIAVVQGTSVSGVASPPAVPNSFIPLLQAGVPAGSATPTLTSVVVRTGSGGIVLPVANAADRSTLPTTFDGLTIWRIDRQWLEVYSVASSGWLVQGTGVTTSLADANAAITTPFIGQRIYRSDARSYYRWDGGTWIHERITGGLRVITAGIITSSSGTTEVNIPKLAMTGKRVKSGTYYILHLSIFGQGSVNSDDFSIKVREDTALSGNTIADFRWVVGNEQVVNSQRTWEGIWKCAADNNSKSFFISVQRLLGTGQLDIQGDVHTGWWIEETTADSAVWTDVP